MTSLESNISLLQAETSIKSKQWKADNYNYLAIGNSITLHPKNDYWWNECGMAASTTDNDYVHQLTDMIEKDRGQVDEYAYNMATWETQVNDRAETLNLLDGLLSDKLNLITIQLGENVTDLNTFESDFKELINYVREKSPNAQIIVIGDFWENDNRDDIKKTVAKELNVGYVDLGKIKDNKQYFAGNGTTVYGDDGAEHEIDHDGVAKHPGDKAMRYIAEETYKKLRKSKMNKPLLSICIPTYNRAAYLKKSIESVICQEEFKSGKVEIVISDNTSTDDTEMIGKEYSSKYDNIIYHRNEENINNDNFPLVLSLGNGVLRRLCNDTLCFEDGALRYICDIIGKYSDTKPFLCWCGLNNKPEIEGLSFKDGIKEVSYWITSIACFSIWDTECVGLENDTDGAELLLWQVRKSLELVSSKNSMVLINKHLTYTQTVENKNISYGLYKVFYQNYFKLYDPYFESGRLSEEDKDYLEKNLLLGFFPTWCVKWKLQNNSLQYSKTENLCDAIYQQYHDKPYWKEYKRIYAKMYLKEKIKNVLRKG